MRAAFGETRPVRREAALAAIRKVAANRNSIHWDDLNWERSYKGQHAYSQSKIAFGMFGLELARRSDANGWDITSNLSHPGVAPTSLLAARPEVGRSKDTVGVRMIRMMSKRGVLVGTVESAMGPALLAATSPTPGATGFFGPSGPGHLGGPPAEQQLFSRLTDAADAARMWETSERLAGVTFPNG